MDAVNFIKERTRMCKSFGDQCEKCAAFNACEDELYSCAVDVESPMNAEDQIDIVETWAKENPRKTRQSVFLEQYPETMRTENGVISICPATLYYSQRYNDGNCKNSSRTCEVCRREFWNQEVE